MTHKKKILYGVVLGVGFLALLVDRLMVARPEQALAAVPRAASGSSISPAVSEPPALDSQIESVAVAPFPQLLSEELPTHPLRDAFTITPAAVQAMGGHASADGGDPSHPKVGSGGSPRYSAARFAAQHRLSAVLETGGFGVAVVDGQWIKPGDALDACKLIEITGRQAVFECHDGAATLEVASSTDESYAP